MLRSSPSNAAQAYLENRIKGAPPVDLIFIAYDMASLACRERDVERFTRVLAVLRNALDFRFDRSAATRLFKTYMHCVRLARQGKFSEAARLLDEWREFWEEARRELENEPAAPEAARREGNPVDVSA